MRLAAATPVPDDGEDDDWIYAVEGCRENEESEEENDKASEGIEMVQREAAVDSAAWTHVCPRSLRADVPLEALR